MKYNKNDIAVMCEIAIILNANGVTGDGLEDFFENKVEPIYKEFFNSNFQGNVTDFVNEKF